MSANKTGYYFHAACRRHEMGPGHPECPERLDAIEDRLLVSGVANALDRREAPEASLDDIVLAHDPRLVAAIDGLREELAEQVDAGGSRYRFIDPDTAMNPHTWEAALRASGAVIAATDAVMAGELQNAFCAVRPPGHHACRNRSMGFCLFNQVAVGARYALERHGLERVAIVDFDVHHGNGTEDILAGDDRVLMVGLFQHPFYPGTGTPPLADNMVNLPVPAYTKGAVVREMIEEAWIPRLEAFRPQMIFFSAGFDAHREDDLGQLGLVEADYAWMTARIKAIADKHAQGRIVSSLEGGYNLSALGRSVEAHLRVLADL
ncbi:MULTISPECIES: histone deacetylase family protein [Ramlibacter]|uniref:Histone deacetylase family protein n=1 Tax=Ramlibacter pinisoli TaxID=2682844 RepID=A0A6N8IQ32_9BURK|nr:MULTISPECIES: histone deacetylase family protein [Ramlibacter]MBA2963709.1 histone deacetylase family protein [Ramlibacter sp. CGMCC 1.13660]MVQ28675.1 histone deacetylase family protein [Ramlibacter pinisoli]